jgi:phage terminase large subunit-like protein
MIPAHRLGKFWALQGTPQAIDIILIKHKTGGWSELGFKNYQQDIGSFMGTSRHAVWLDEECPLDIYNECNIRTATTDGIMMVTFTPLDGLTPMVVNFCRKADFLVGAKPIVAVDQTVAEGENHLADAEYAGFDKTKAVVQAGWDDAPWLDEKTKHRLLEDTPIHLRESRSKGLPAMGSGNVYAVPFEEIQCDTFAIPASWPRMYALDVGWNRTAALWCALDPATDTMYIYDEHYVGDQVPAVHAYAIKSRGEWITGVIDPASRGRSMSDGQKIIRMYKDQGLNLFLAKNEVDSGVQMIQQRLVARKIKVFKTCMNLHKEYLLYRRDKNGRIIKEDDHLLDCLRYIVNNMQRMSSKSEHPSNRSLTYAPSKYDI